MERSDETGLWLLRESSLPPLDVDCVEKPLLPPPLPLNDDVPEFDADCDDGASLMHDLNEDCTETDMRKSWDCLLTVVIVVDDDGFG